MKRRRFQCGICNALYDWSAEVPKCTTEGCDSEISEVNIDLNKIATVILRSIEGELDGEGDEVYRRCGRDDSVVVMVSALTDKERSTLMSYISSEIGNIVASVRFNDLGEVEEAPVYHQKQGHHKDCVACTQDWKEIGKPVKNAAFVPGSCNEAMYVDDDQKNDR